VALHEPVPIMAHFDDMLELLAKLIPVVLPETSVLKVPEIHGHSHSQHSTHPSTHTNTYTLL
jgi:hypothetical protein